MSDVSFIAKTGEEFDRLVDCIDWAMKNSSQGPPELGTEQHSLLPMLIVCRQKPYRIRNSDELKAKRSYVALSTSVFESFFTSFKTDAMRHLDELVPDDAPCKFFMDCEWEIAKLGMATYASEKELFAALQASFVALVAHVVQFHAEHHAAVVVPYIVTATRAGKWSNHVIFDGAIWKSTRHCGAFAKTLLAFDSHAAKYIDPGVYKTNHTLRMYRCSKALSPASSFVIPGAATDPSAPIDFEFLQHSLITYFPIPIPDSDEVYFITSLFAKRFASMIDLDFIEHPNAERTAILANTLSLQQPSSGGAGMSAHEIGAQWQSAFKSAFATYKPYDIKCDLMRGMMTIACRNRRCVIKGGEHTSNNIFLQVDLTEYAWRQNCHNHVCSQTPTEWQSLPESLQEVCVRIYDDWIASQRASDLSIYDVRLRGF